MDPLNSLGQNSGVGSLSLLQGIFPAQGLNPGLPHCRRILYQLSHKGSPNKTKPFSKRTGHLFGATILLNIFSSGPVDFKIQSIALSYTNNNSSYTYPALTNYNSYNSGDRLFPLNKQTKQHKTQLWFIKVGEIAYGCHARLQGIFPTQG